MSGAEGQQPVLSILLDSQALDPALPFEVGAPMGDPLGSSLHDLNPPALQESLQGSLCNLLVEPDPRAILLGTAHFLDLNHALSAAKGQLAQLDTALVAPVDLLPQLVEVDIKPLGAIDIEDERPPPAEHADIDILSASTVETVFPPLEPWHRNPCDELLDRVLGQLPIPIAALTVAATPFAIRAEEYGLREVTDQLPVSAFEVDTDGRGLSALHGDG